MRFAEVLRTGYRLDLEQDFRSAGELDRSVWFPHHLPQWSSSTASAARYVLDADGLHLLIEPDQRPWCPEFDGDTRVSSLQTGVFSGPSGSTIGQHRFAPEVVVREPQRNVALYTPYLGAFALRARVTAHPDCMAALWMIGYEDEPARSGEICIVEIFGRNVDATSARIGMGIHPFGDPALVDDFAEVPVPLDVTETHEYAATWTTERVVFYVDDEPVHAVEQSPRYPMQLMLGIYGFGEVPPTEPQRFTVERLRCYRPAEDRPARAAREAGSPRGAGR